MSTRLHSGPFVANDNAPAYGVPRGDAVGFNALLRERQNAALYGDPQSPETSHQKYGFWLSIMLWAGFGLGLIWSFYTSQSVGIRIFSAIGLIWSGLWTRYLAIDHKYPRFAEVSLLSTLLASIGLMVTATMQLGFPMTLPGGLCFFMAAALTVSWVNQSHIALIAAISAGLLWAALHIDGYLSSGIYALAIPALWAGMILQSIKLKSSLGIIASVIISYLWLAGSAGQAFNEGQITPLFLAAGAVVMGTLHYRGAKAAEDEGMPHTSIHVIFGWILAMTGMIGLANYAVNPLQPIWVDSQDNAQLARLAWAAVMLFALCIVFFTGLIRRKHKRMSLAGVSLTTLLLALIPLALWFEEPLITAFTETTGLPLYPHIGLFLFGAIAGNVLFFIANSFRRGRFIHVIVGLGVTILMVNFGNGLELQYSENWIIWALGFAGSVIVTLLALEPQLESENDAPRNSVSSR